MEEIKSRLKELRDFSNKLWLNKRINEDDFNIMVDIINSLENSLNQSERQPITDNKGNGNKFYCSLIENQLAHSPRCDKQCNMCKSG